MTSKKDKAPEQSGETVVLDPKQWSGRLKPLGGSDSDDWNNILCNQAVNTLWTGHSHPEDVAKQRTATVAALRGIAPRDEIESMISAQLIATHNAAMECFRRGMISEQTFEGRKENLNQATKLTRASAALVEALNRHRGKGQQEGDCRACACSQRRTSDCGNNRDRSGWGRKKDLEQPHAG